MPPVDHQINISYRKRPDGKWEVLVTGVTSGLEVHFGDGDDGQITFCLDASRFTPWVRVR